MLKPLPSPGYTPQCLQTGHSPHMHTHTHTHTHTPTFAGSLHYSMQSTAHSVLTQPFPPWHEPLKMLITWRSRSLESQAASHHSYSHKCYSDEEGFGVEVRAGVTVRRIAAVEGHGVDGPSEAEALHQAALLLRHAASGRQGAVVPVATVCFEAQLVGRAFRHNEVELNLLV